MEKGDMVSNDSKSYFQMRKPNIWPLQEIVGLSVGDGSQSSVLIKDEADEWISRQNHCLTDWNSVNDYFR